MCGVCGILAFRDTFPSGQAIAEAMADTMRHRGPDDAGASSLAGGAVSLAHRRLSIVDLSASGRQPLSNEDGDVWITFNGEIYNHLELRAGLRARGHRYRSETDTESIVHLYEEAGRRCVEQLHGMFAFGLWDDRRGELLLARDRLGVKPLFVARFPDGLVFASEIKSLLRHPRLAADLDEEAFFHYLTFASTPAPLTMFKGVTKLAPGERMVVRADGSTSSDIYWDPFAMSTQRQVEEMGDLEMEARFIDLLRSSIKKRMMADVPFGVFLSGGIDSSANVALMSELVDEPIRTFSVGFRGYRRHNELAPAARVAQHFGTDHEEIELELADLEEFIPRMVAHHDEPIADWISVPLFFLARLARETGTPVVQVGEGADEILHGYEHYLSVVQLEQLVGSRLRRGPAALRLAATALATRSADVLGRGRNSAQVIAHAASQRAPFWGGAICFDAHIKGQVLIDQPRHLDSYAVVERLWSDAEQRGANGDLLKKMTYVELKQRLAELLLMRVDRMTMATSVEARVPFLDHELVEFVLALPPAAKVRGRTGKWILRRAMTGILPDDVIARPKQGFSAPIDEWFRGDLGRRAQEEIRSSTLAERGLLDYPRIDRLWKSHRRRHANWAFQLWNLYTLSLWHDQWIAGRARQPA